jgi:two-component system nitrate/nitrite response regulator NarL
MTGTPLKVLIADDHPLILEGIRRGLERTESIEVVGAAHSASAAMSLIESRRPDVVLLDLLMPDVKGTEHIEQVRANWPDLKVVVLSGSEDRSLIEASLRAGASAFVVKSVATADLASVLRQVANGSVFHAVGQSPASAGGHSGELELPELTERERVILQAIARGATTAQISQELWVSEHTVKFHLTNIYRKLDVPNRAAAVRWAIEHGVAE